MKAWNRGRCWPTGNIWTPGHRSSGSSNYARDSKFNPVACSFLHSGPQLRLFWSWTRTTGSSALDCAIREHSLLCSAASDAADNVEGKSENFRLTMTQVSVHETATSMNSWSGINKNSLKTLAYLTNNGKVKHRDIVATMVMTAMQCGALIWARGNVQLPVLDSAHHNSATYGSKCGAE